MITVSAVEKYCPLCDLLHQKLEMSTTFKRTNYISMTFDKSSRIISPNIIIVTACV